MKIFNIYCKFATSHSGLVSPLSSTTEKAALIIVWGFFFNRYIFYFAKYSVNNFCLQVPIPAFSVSILRSYILAVIPWRKSYSNNFKRSSASFFGYFRPVVWNFLNCTSLSKNNVLVQILEVCFRTCFMSIWYFSMKKICLRKKFNGWL